MQSGAPVLVLNTTTRREHGRKAQLANVQAARSVADIIRTTLGPRSMLKMLLDPMGGIVMTNDGNAILREVDVSHPAAKSMIELARTQDEEVGDGTTSVIILAGEMLSVAEPFLLRNIHPRIIVGAYINALDDALKILDSYCIPLDLTDRPSMLDLVKSCLSTKFVSRFGDQVANMALDAVLKITVTSTTKVYNATNNKDEDGKKEKEIDIKRYARIEKLPGGYLEDSEVLDGIMLNKDVIHPKMSRYIENPRILLLDCPLEFKKAESQTSIEVKKDEDWQTILRMEEEFIAKQCSEIIKFKPTLVCTEKGVADLAAHFLQKAGISVLRRLKKTDNNRIARATGATIVSMTEEIRESDIGTGCGLFETKKFGDEYFCFLVKCKDPKAVTIVLRGGSKDILNEVERNLNDAMAVVRNIVQDPRVVPGGGACEMAIAAALTARALSSTSSVSSSGQTSGASGASGVGSWPYRAVASALEVIPRTLIENCGASTIRLLTALRAKHHAAQKEGTRCTWGVDGNKGELVDMTVLKIYEPLAVKTQTIKTAVESACMLLRIDDIVSGLSGKGKEGGGGGQQQQEDEETFGDARDG